MRAHLDLIVWHWKTEETPLWLHNKGLNMYVNHHRVKDGRKLSLHLILKRSTAVTKAAATEMTGRKRKQTSPA